MQDATPRTDPNICLSPFSPAWCSSTESTRLCESQDRVAPGRARPRRCRRTGRRPHSDAWPRDRGSLRSRSVLCRSLPLASQLLICRRHSIPARDYSGSAPRRAPRSCQYARGVTARPRMAGAPCQKPCDRTHAYRPWSGVRVPRTCAPSQSAPFVVQDICRNIAGTEITLLTYVMLISAHIPDLDSCLEDRPRDKFRAH